MGGRDRERERWERNVFGDLQRRRGYEQQENQREEETRENGEEAVREHRQGGLDRLDDLSRPRRSSHHRDGQRAAASGARAAADGRPHRDAFQSAAVVKLPSIHRATTLAEEWTGQDERQAEPLATVRQDPQASQIQAPPAAAGHGGPVRQRGVQKHVETRQQSLWGAL